jgi:endogenous inhibitor of DNA gyrase (YacG/DUF329 family)
MKRSRPVNCEVCGRLFWTSERDGNGPLYCCQGCDDAYLDEWEAEQAAKARAAGFGSWEEQLEAQRQAAEAAP